jgi:hypothetical protein
MIAVTQGARRLWLAGAIIIGALACATPAQADTCNFTAGPFELWSTAGHWSCAHVPTAADDVVLDGTDNPNVFGTDAVALTLTTSGGTRIGFGDSPRAVTVTGAWNTTGGKIAGSGTVASGAFSKTGAGLLELQGGTVVLNGTSSISGGRICVGVFQQGFGFMEINGTFSVLDGAEATPLDNCGNGGRIRVNQPSGRFLKNSPGSSTVSQSFDNDDTVEVLQGDLLVSNGEAGNAQTGTWIVPALHALRFTGGFNSVAAGGSVTGAGTVGMQSGGVLSLADGGTYQVASTEITGGTFNALGAGLATTGSLRLDGGARSGDRTITAGTMDARSGQLKDSGNTLVTGAFAKTTAGAVEFRGGRLTLDGASSISGGTLALGVNQDGNGFMDIGGTFTILPGAPDQAFPNLGNQGRIRVKPGGRFVKDSPGPTTVVQGIENDGQVELVQGMLIVSQGFGDAGEGDWLVPAGTFLRFAGGSTAGHNFFGEGTLQAFGGSVTVDDGGTYSVQHTEIGGGTLNLAGLTGTAATDSLVLTGGARSGARTFAVGTFDARGGRLQAAGPTVVSGAFDKTTLGALEMRGAILTLNGASSISGGQICVGVFQDGGGTVNVAGTLTIDAAGDAVPLANCGNASQLNLKGPNGRLQLTGAATKTIGPDTTNEGGTVAVGAGQTLTFDGIHTQTGGSTIVNGTLGGNLALSGGALRGNGTVTGSVTNTSGVVQPGGSTGHLTVASYTQGAAGSIDVEIEGTGQGTTYDWLEVTGLATLDGTVNVLRPTGFDPALADVFQFVTSGTRTGEFDTPPVFAPLPGGKTFLLNHPAGAPLGAQLLLQPPPAPDNTGIPVIDGTVAVGSTVTCLEGTWTGDPAFTYRWLANGIAIGGATLRTFAIGAAQATTQLTCEVVGTNLGGFETATSAPVLVPAVAPTNITPPAINGTPAAGQALTCVAGTWNGAPPPTFGYEWLRNGVVITTGQGYTVVAADQGASLTCRETATNVAGSAAATSAALAVPVPTPPPAATATPTPAPAPTAAPTVTPTPTPEQKLAAATPTQVATAFGLPSSRKCVSRRKFPIKLVVPRGVKVGKAAVTVNTKRLKVRKVGARYTASIDLRGLPKGRFTVKIKITTTSGRVINGSRRYRTCAPRK